MTVQLEFPIVEFQGDGAQTTFVFNWSSQDRNELKVELDGRLLTENSDYDLTEYAEATGGTIVMRAAPVPGSVLTLYRETPITQEVDYVPGTPFPANTHENQMDKDTRILQEGIYGGRAVGGSVDLRAIQSPRDVTIENTAGTDAVIPIFNCDSLAGVFAAEITQSAPADGAATTKPDGFVWFEVPTAPPPPPNGILLTPDLLTASYAASTVAGGRFITGTIQTTPEVFRVISSGGDYPPGPETGRTEPLYETAPTGINQYWIRLDTADLWNYNAQPLNQWLDVWSEGGNSLLWGVSLFAPQGDTGAVTVQGTLRIAPDDSGAPDLALEVVKPITINLTLTN